MKLTILTFITAALISVSPSFAQGVSSDAPGHKTKNYKGSPGASYWAPGHEKKNPKLRNPNPGSPGASGYAPGHSTTGSATKH